MKNLSAQLQAHLAGEETTLVSCAKITLTKYPTRIVNITQANPGVVETRWAHQLSDGDTARLRIIRGMTELNRLDVQVTVIDPTHFSIGLNTTIYSPYTHKGIVEKVVGYTEHVDDIVFENIRYQSTLGYMPASVRQGSKMAMDTLDHRGLLLSRAKAAAEGEDDLLGIIQAVSEEDMAAGRYDNAQVEIFLVTYEDLTQGKLILPISGRFGELVMHRGTYETELANKAQNLQETFQSAYSWRCRADLGDDFDGSEPEHKLYPGFGCKVRLDPQIWRPLTEVSFRPPAEGGLGSVVRPAASGYSLGRQFRCSVPGITGTVEPAWNLTVGGTTIDGSAEWLTMEALTKEGIVYAVIDRRRFIDNDRYEAPIVVPSGGASTLFEIVDVNIGAKRFDILGNHVADFPASRRFNIVNSPGNDGEYTVNSATLLAGPTRTRITVTEEPASGSPSGSIVGRLDGLLGFFTFGKVTFLDGFNIGISREVRTFAVSTADGGLTFTGPGEIELFEELPFPLNVGDRYEITAGCDKSLVVCDERYDNVNNRRAEDNLPMTDKMLLYPDATGGA